MILKYNFDNANQILEYAKQNKLSSLSIYKIEGKVVFDYKLIDHSLYSAQHKIKRILHNSAPVRFKMISLLEAYIIALEEEKPVSLTLNFDATTAPIAKLTYRFIGDSSITDTIADRTAEMHRLLKRMKKLSMDLGISGTTLDNAFTKQGEGKRKKHIPLTVSDVIEKLRISLGEDDES